MENSKLWNPKKNYFVLLLPTMAHESIGWIEGLFKWQIRTQTKNQPIPMNHAILLKLNLIVKTYLLSCSSMKLAK
jgi:hypothetical protein